MTFNINLWSFNKRYFWFPRLSGVTIARSLSGSTRDFLKLSYICLIITKFLKFSKVRSDLIFETSTQECF